MTEPFKNSHSSSSTVRVYLSYAEEDRVLLDKLISHLKIMTHGGLIQPWHPGLGSAGTQVKEEALRQLQHAKIILLLLSAEYFSSDNSNYSFDSPSYSSDYRVGTELSEAKKLYDKSLARVVPVILRPVDWRRNQFLQNLAPLPRNGKPVTTWANPDEAFFDISEGIGRIVEEVKTVKTISPLPPPPDPTPTPPPPPDPTPAPLPPPDPTPIPPPSPDPTRRAFIKYVIAGAGITTALSLTPRVVRTVRNSLKTFSSDFEVVIVDHQGKVVERFQRRARILIEDLYNNIELEMVAVPGGEFVMGSASGDGIPEETPQRSVSIDPFFVGKYPVTQAQWQAVARLPRVDIDLELDPSVYKGSSLPVEWVSWQDAVEFCKRLSQLTGRNYRLPSEAEWEYACRATTTTAYHFGPVLTPDLANYDDPSVGRRLTTAVGSFNVANEFGLFDMHGNVWELCADYWHDNYEGAPLDGIPWTTGGYSDLRVIRGGSWVYPMQNSRSAERLNETLNQRSNDTGFRVAFSDS